ncbi:MAG: queuosine precursor transporter [Candidatus Kaiserbacteria bacterium]|nr:queuosine precursor transporter [Candidatus Kaiserbacteria bacterium]
MITELLFLSVICIDLFFIYLAWRFGKLYLAVTLVMNIVLTVIFAGQIVQLFGTMVGLSALFFAPVFVITNMVNERYGKTEAKRMMHIGLFSLVVLLALLYLGTSIPSSLETAEMSDALAILFHISVRMVFGTIITYYVAQQITIYLYRKIGDLTKGKLLWLRHNAAIIIALAADSILFYPIAFYGNVSLETLLTITITGWLIKCLVPILATPITYLIKRR